MSLWGVSFLVDAKQIDPAKAAFIGSLFFVGITAGRMVGGFVCLRLSNEKLIGMGAILCGVALFSLALGQAKIAPIAFFIIGLGCGPIFPSLLFEIPRRCAVSESQKIIGLAMASMYTASIIGPIGLGFLGQRLGMQSMVVVQIGSFVLLSLFLWRFLGNTIDTDTP